MESVAKVVLMRRFSAFTALDVFLDLRFMQSKKAKFKTALWLELVPLQMELLLTGSGNGSRSSIRNKNFFPKNTNPFT